MLSDYFTLFKEYESKLSKRNNLSWIILHSIERNHSLRCSNCFCVYFPPFDEAQIEIAIFREIKSLLKYWTLRTAYLKCSLWFVKLFRLLVKILGFLVFCNIFVMFCLVKSWAGEQFKPWIWVNKVNLLVFDTWEDYFFNVLCVFGY